MIEIIKRNKFIFFIIVLIIIFFLVLLRSILKSNITFYLMGSEKMIVLKDSDFVDPMFVAYDKEKNIYDFVSVVGYVNTSIPGTYEIEYNLDYKNYSGKLIRHVSVISNQDKKYEIVLNGSSVVYTLLGSDYVDKGAYVINTLDGTKDSNVTVKSNVNTNVLGEYNVTYSYNSIDESVSISRKVIVFDLSYSAVKTNDDVLINLLVGDTENYFYTRLPNGKYSYDNKVSYLATTNGDYPFYIYDTLGNVFKKIVSVLNIKKDYSCSGIININGTNMVVANNLGSLSSVKEYKWNIDGFLTITNTNSLKLEKIVNNAMVTITTQNGLNHDVSCSILDNLAYHFKYDEYNTKQFMSCNTYNQNDRVMLENRLASAVSLAGYGTRAGVVEAARFIVGGLDYKIPYLGPKTVNSSLGVYPYKGLNIANKNGWGCYVSGWLQGLDCTNFVSWAFKQNGLDVKNIYGTTDTYKTRSVVNRLRVGDLLLTPCEINCKSDFQHVGVIIGIDDNYIYVAEATTGNINATIVSKWQKNNMPQSGYFSIARLYNYDKEGNITNMWLS